MIERKFIDDKKKEFEISKFIEKKVKRAGFSSAKLIKTPLGDKIIVAAMKPGLVVGPKGRTIKSLTDVLRTKYKLENPQIEVEEVVNAKQNPKVIANYIVFSMERYGMKGYKGAVYRSMRDIMASGAVGVEIVISGKIPSSRARNWKFKEGYFKKSGDIALNGVKRAIVQAKLKTGVVGIKVNILPGDLEFPDKMELKDVPTSILEETTNENGVIEKTEVSNDVIETTINQREVVEEKVEDTKKIPKEKAKTAEESNNKTTKKKDVATKRKDDVVQEQKDSSKKE